MANKRKSKNQNPNQSQNQTQQILSEPKPQTIEEIVLNIIKANRTIGSKVQTLVPCLYGESGTGKTMRAHKIAEQLGLPIKVILLHSMLPEEVLGLPRVVDGQTIWALPEWYSTEPTLYFFDELDKVREEELGTILTLLADKRIRDVKLHPDSVILVGMQPIEPSYWTSTKTGQALVARMIFLPTNGQEAINYLSQKYNIKLDFVKYSDKIELPLIMPTPRQIEYVLNLMQVLLRDEWLPIVKGIFPPDFLKVFLEEVEKSGFFLDPKLLCEALNKQPELVHKLSVPELLELGGPIMQYCNPQIIAEVEGRILLECTPEEWLRFQNLRFDYLYNIAIKSPDKSVDVGNNCTVEEFYKAFETVMPGVIDELNKRKEANDAKS